MNDKARINVGIAGLGTVGSATFTILNRNFDNFFQKTDTEIMVSHIASRRENPSVDIKGSRFAKEIKFSNDVFALVNDEQIDIVIELIGGTDVAYELVKQSLLAGKHVVTANKALIAERGNDLFEIARTTNKVLAFEAAVAGGIPIIKALTEGLAANRVEWLAGIINGTGNFILTEMQEKGRNFDEVLEEAQALGYAEADPSFDVEGTDAAHKLAILASLAFSMPIDFPKVFTEGITQITTMDLQFADNFGYKIKHLGIIRNTGKGIEARVHPTLVPKKNLIAKVDGVMNAVMVKCDAVGSTMYYGAGAGGEPTGSAVCADVLDLVCGNHCAKQFNFFETQRFIGIDEIYSAYYLRLHVHDQAGVLAAISRVLSEQNISIEGIYQQEVQEGDTSVPVVIISQRVLESDMNQAINEMEALPSTLGKISKIRIEHFKA